MNDSDIAALNKRFGAPGRIAFRTDGDGHPVAVLVNRYGACEVALHGARVLTYRPTGHMPVLFTSRTPATGLGQPIPDGIRVCWPWFGPAVDPAQPADGFARLMPWSLLTTEYSADTTEIRLALTTSDETRRYWPSAFELTLKIKLDQHLNLTLVTRNCDTAPFVVTQTLFPFLRVRQIMDANVRGLDRAPFLDRLSGQTGIQDGPLNIRAATDKLFTPSVPQCVLHDPGIGRAIALVYSGARQLTVWNPWTDKSRELPGFDDDAYTRLLGLAPSDADGLTLPPGAAHTLTLALQATFPS